MHNRKTTRFSRFGKRTVVCSSRLLLFDIDGTLLTTGGAGKRAFNQACAELAGIAAALDGVVLDGATDLAIVREIFERSGRDPHPATVVELLARYAALLPEALADAPRFEVLPGVATVLERLTAERRPIGLCTGNVRAGAEAKLQRAGLAEHFFGERPTPHFGGFGNDAEDRVDIVHCALSRAGVALGRRVAPSEALVIGDTPRDVSAARAAGVEVLAVATGRFAAQELRDSGATHVVESLATPQALALMEIA